MKKLKTLILLSTFSATVFAQPQAPAPVPAPAQSQTQNKSIVDIVNEKLSGQINEEQQKKAKNEKDNATEDLSKYYNTPGSDYDKKVNTGLDDYRGRKDDLQRRIEELKLEREAKIKQQVELESKLRLEALRIAEESRVKQLQMEAQKKKETAATSSAQSDEKKKPQRKVISSDTKDYYEKQRKLMETQSY
jgi:hypothetical protein